MAVRYQGGKAVPANLPLLRAQKITLLEAASAINVLRQLDLPRDMESTILQLQAQMDEHAREVAVGLGER